MTTKPSIEAPPEPAVEIVEPGASAGERPDAVPASGDTAPVDASSGAAFPLVVTGSGAVIEARSERVAESASAASGELERLRQQVEAVERQLAARERKIAALQVRVEEQTAEIERQRGAAARRNSLTRELRESLQAESKRVGLEQRRARVLQKENSGLAAKLESAQGKVKRLAASNTELTAEVTRLRAGSGLQLLTQPRALQWFTRPRQRTQLRLGREVVVVGEGPVVQSEMHRLLKRSGLVVRATGDGDAEIMVVGRDGWLIDELEEQIAARKDRELKVFSQEMLIAALATRDDPFESADRKTLLAFAEGHEALTYLIEAGFEWPFITWKPLQTVNQFADGSFAEESPIHRMGYVVGKVAGLPEKARQGILAEAFTGKLPKVHSAEYMATWGSAGSRIRLRRMATHIATFARLWQNEPNFETAVAHWEADLGWLEQEFYEPWMRFIWPETQV